MITTKITTQEPRISKKNRMTSGIDTGENTEYTQTESSKNLNEPWKFVLQNMEGLISENSKRKVEYIDEYLKSNKIIFMNMTETWLNDTIKEDVEIKGHTIFRSDRKNIKRGGVATYLNEKLEAIQLAALSHGKCELIAIYISSIQTVNIVIYRPPKTASEEFNIILEKLRDIMNVIRNPDPTIIMSGDFNFPFVKWTRLPNYSCSWEYIANTNATKDEKQQFEKLMEICSHQCMLQIIQEPTREGNTLDLIFTNETALVKEIEVNKTTLSDHNCIEISTCYKIRDKANKTEGKKGLTCTHRLLNFHSSTTNWKSIYEQVKRTPWRSILQDKDTIDGSKEFESTLSSIFIENIPKRIIRPNHSIPRERKKLINRIKMLKRNKHRARSIVKKNIIEGKILETEQKLLEQKRNEKLYREQKAIECMEKNPKMLFSYIKQQKNRHTEIGPFKQGNELIYDNEKICNCLKDQYVSQYTTREERENIQLFNDSISSDLCDIIFTRKDIEEAIDELDENSAAGPDGIPALFLKKTKKVISLPLKILLRKSLDEGKIPKIYKMAYVTPIYKGGSKQKPENYRPVSLTSHIMKVFERVIRKAIMKFLIDKQLFNDGQHGFVKGRSTQSQLLAHYNDIYEAIMEGKRMDTVFLDFSKAFDKVDHNILLKKVRNHGISGKLGKWIQSFLQYRKFRVVANGCISEEEDVVSGVPQGTVLAAILFVIMIADINENVKKCIVRSYADDTRVNNKINDESDKEDMQKDLENIYKWASENKMQFNENKFEQMAHGSSNNTSIDAYKTPSGEDIEIKSTAKDLGILANCDLKFKEHIHKITTSAKITMGALLRSFSTRDEKPMLKLFNAYIKSKIEYCCIVWTPDQQNLINELENIQRIFTAKIKGMEELNYHERLKKLNMYSLERRRDRYLIIYGWQQIENIKENVLNLKTSWRGTGRRIISKGIPGQVEGRRLKRSEITSIYNSPARKIERAFNCLPNHIKNITGVKTDTFKNKLDNWLRQVPDLPKCGRYAKWVSAKSNSIQDQAVNLTRG